MVHLHPLNCRLSWLLALAVLYSTLISFSTVDFAMANDNPRYRLESAPPCHPKMRLSLPLENCHEPALIEASVKVSAPGYVPDGVEIRARISPVLFTGIIPREILPTVLRDPKVVSVDPSQPQRLFDTKGE